MSLPFLAKSVILSQGVESLLDSKDSGTYTVAAQLSSSLVYTVSGTMDGKQWYAIDSSVAISTGGIERGNCSGFKTLRLKCVSGSGVVDWSVVGQPVSEFTGTVTANPSVAHGSTSSTTPYNSGGKAETSLSTVTPVADGQATHAYYTTDGRQILSPYTNPEDIVSGNASNTDGTSTQVIAAQAAGIKVALTTIIVTNAHATTFAYVEIKDGVTAKLTIPVPPASGAVVSLPVPLIGTAATAWNFDPSAAVTTLYCSMIGYKTLV